MGNRQTYRSISRQHRQGSESPTASQGGLVPGVCYGTGVDKPLSISVDPKALKASLDPAKRQNTVISLTVEGDTSTNLTAMLWDYQIHPIRREVTHVEHSYRSITNKVIEAEVPVEYSGKAKGLVDGGQLNSARHSVQVRAKPADIPARLMLDISELDIGEVLHVSDLNVPAGVEMVTRHQANRGPLRRTED